MASAIRAATTSSLPSEASTLGRGGSDYTAAILAAALDADVLEITKDTVKYTNHDGSYTTEEKYKCSMIGDEPELKLEDTFIYEDMYYNKAEDRIIAYTWSHTDGDGGHHRIEYEDAPELALVDSNLVSL